MADDTTKNESKKKDTIIADEEDEEEEDPFYTRIDKSGCSKYHYALQVVLYPHSSLDVSQ